MEDPRPLPSYVTEEAAIAGRPPQRNASRVAAGGVSLPDSVAPIACPEEELREVFSAWRHRPSYYYRHGARGHLQKHSVDPGGRETPVSLQLHAAKLHQKTHHGRRLAQCGPQDERHG